MVHSANDISLVLMEKHADGPTVLLDGPRNKFNPGTQLNNPWGHQGNLSHPGDFLFNRYTLIGILWHNLFPGTPRQNTILGTLLALVS